MNGVFMAKLNRRKLRWIILASIAAAAVAFYLYKYYQAKRYELPEGIASGNGRVEAKRVDIIAKESLRVEQIFVDEGDFVEPGQILVKLDTATLEAQLAESKANLAATEERLAMVESAIARQKSQYELAQIEVERSRKLVEERAGSQQDYDLRKTNLQTSAAALSEEKARLETVKKEIEAAQANVEVIQTRIDDATLRSPVRGRVLYRLAEVGEVLGPGGKALTLVNLEDVYMEIFLPSQQAARLDVGAEARITLDYASGRAVAGYVSFVSPESQFTPKQVETRSERDKLMFRVKIQAPQELVSYYIQNIKTGVRGVGYVKSEKSAKWPWWLQNLITPPDEPNIQKQPMKNKTENQKQQR